MSGNKEIKGILHQFFADFRFYAFGFGAIAPLPAALNGEFSSIWWITAAISFVLTLWVVRSDRPAVFGAAARSAREIRTGRGEIRTDSFNRRASCVDSVQLLRKEAEIDAAHAASGDFAVEVSSYA